MPCQVLWNSLALKLNVCFRAVFKNEKISTVIHSKEVRNFAWKWLGNKTFFSSGEQIPAGLLQPLEVEHGRAEATKETEDKEGHPVVLGSCAFFLALAWTQCWQSQSVRKLFSIFCS